MTIYKPTVERHRKKCPSRLGEMLQSSIKLRSRRASPELQERIDALQHLLAIYQPPRRKPPRVSRHLPPRPYPRWQPIIDECCGRHRISRQELFAGFRDRRVIPCRHEIWWILAKVLDVPLMRIGERMGGYHHTSILHGVRMHQARMDEERQAAA